MTEDFIAFDQPDSYGKRSLSCQCVERERSSVGSTMDPKRYRIFRVTLTGGGVECVCPGCGRGIRVMGNFTGFDFIPKSDL